MKLDHNGKIFLQQREGFSPVPYLCPAGVPTIGFGNTFYPDGRKVTMKDKPITRAYAEQIFDLVTAKFEREVNSLLKVQLNQNQYNAILSFAYNEGTDIDADKIPEGLGDSHLLVLINANPNDPRIAAEFAKWIRCNGKPNKGLISRRQLETELYFKK